MSLNFKVVRKGTFIAESGPPLTAVLLADNWDDFGYKTFFVLYFYDETGKLHEIGALRIGFKGQTAGYTSERIGSHFTQLGDEFFSLGNSVEYYTYYRDKLPGNILNELLASLRDVAYNTSLLSAANQENVFGVSLLRDTSLSVVTSQYVRILKGEATLTSYNFSYKRLRTPDYSGIKVDFKVEPESKPSTNIHILIGRNGVGKTTLLNSMVSAALDSDVNNVAGFFANNEKNWLMELNGTDVALERDYFSGIISVSFSAFDPFIPPQEQADPSKGICYYYIGLKDIKTENARHKETAELCQDFISSIKSCFQIRPKKDLWLNAINVLESDGNFAEMNLSSLTNDNINLSHTAEALFRKMSSGHAIVLLTLTKLIEKVEEKTLVLLDEPESHLHPPLLAAFTRALSDLLIKRNGIAVIATHSPVVLQEVPKSCVSILRRSRLETRVDRPEVETFAENVGILTREVFGLEVSISGFHALLEKSVSSGKTFAEIMDEYDGQIGLEGKAIIQSLINTRSQ